MKTRLRQRSSVIVPNSQRIIANRDYYSESFNQAIQASQTTPFAGTSGTGHGTLANRPAICTPGVGYWATDQGNWNQSGNGGQGQLFVCVHQTPGPFITPRTPIRIPSQRLRPQARVPWQLSSPLGAWSLFQSSDNSKRRSFDICFVAADTKLNATLLLGNHLVYNLNEVKTLVGEFSRE